MRNATRWTWVAAVLVAGLWAVPAGAKHGRPADRVEPPPRVETHARWTFVRHDDREAVRVIDACERVTVGRRPTEQCIRAGLDFRGEAVQAIQACGRAMIGDRATVECVELASRARFRPAALVRACDRALTGNDAVLRCVARTSRAWHDATRVVRACGRQSIGNVRTLACIDATLSAQARR